MQKKLRYGKIVEDQVYYKVLSFNPFITEAIIIHGLRHERVKSEFVT